MEALRILEIGQFSLVKACRPAETTMVFTGDDRADAQGRDWLTFGPMLWPWLVKSLAEGRWDFVFCHVPVHPLWARRHGLGHALLQLLRRLRRPQTFGTSALYRRSPCPLVLLDFNDEPCIPAHVHGLLDRALLYFKRELPVDPAKAFRDTTWALRDLPRVAASTFVHRNLPKLRPVPIALSAAIVEAAPTATVDKDIDVFFAGSMHSALRTAGVETLRALARDGYDIEIHAGGLSRHDYLARCAKAWLTLSPEGFGWECFRHYEAAICRSVPLLSPPGILRHRPLLPGEHALYYRAEGDDLRNVIVAALADKERLGRMAAAARTHVLAHHTHARIVDHIVATAQAEIALAAARSSPPAQDRL